MEAQFNQHDVLKQKEPDLEHPATYRYVIGKVVVTPAEIVYQVGVFDQGKLVGAGAMNHKMHDKLVKVMATRAFYAPDDCLADVHEQDFEGQIVVLRLNRLGSDCRIPENQLWRAEDGFGCKPHLAGRAVFAQCLADGEHARWARQDFFGILKPELAPEAYRTKDVKRIKMPTWNEMSEREQRIWNGVHIMGWALQTAMDGQTEYLDNGLALSGGLFIEPVSSAWRLDDYGNVWNPITNLNQAWEAEQRILSGAVLSKLKYTLALRETLKAMDGSFESIFRMAHASAAERCEAMYHAWITQTI